MNDIREEELIALMLCDLEDDQAAELRGRIDSDPEAQKLLDEYQSLLKHLRNVPEIEPSEGFRKSLKSRIQGTTVPGVGAASRRLEKLRRQTWPMRPIPMNPVAWISPLRSAAFPPPRP